MTVKLLCPGCGAPREPGRLACKPCWFALPFPLRRQVWTAHRQHDFATYSRLLSQAKAFWGTR